MEQIIWKDFEKVELRAGTIIGVEDLPIFRAAKWFFCTLRGRCRMVRNSGKSFYSKFIFL